MSRSVEQNNRLDFIVELEFGDYPNLDFTVSQDHYNDLGDNYLFKIDFKCTRPSVFYSPITNDCWVHAYNLDSISEEIIRTRVIKYFNKCVSCRMFSK